MKKYSFVAVVGTVGAAVSNFIGGWDSALGTLVTLMVIDFISGLLIAGLFRRSDKTETGGLSSNVGWKGLAKKVFVLMFVLVGHRLDLTLGVNFVRQSIVIGYIAVELISLTENAGIMGLPLPEVITQAVDLLKGKSEVKKNEKNSS